MTKQRVFTILFIVLGLVIIVFFGMRVVRTFRRMHRDGDGPNWGKPPAAKQGDVSLIRDWMTIPYIANTYDVPPQILFRNVEIFPKDGDDKKSLKQLNDQYYPDQPGVILAHIQAAIQALQKQEPPPHFPATPVFTPTTTP